MLKVNGGPESAFCFRSVSGSNEVMVTWWRRPGELQKVNAGGFSRVKSGTPSNKRGGVAYSMAQQSGNATTHINAVASVVAAVKGFGALAGTSATLASIIAAVSAKGALVGTSATACMMSASIRGYVNLSSGMVGLSSVADTAVASGRLVTSILALSTINAAISSKGAMTSAVTTSVAVAGSISGYGAAASAVSGYAAITANGQNIHAYGLMANIQMGKSPTTDEIAAAVVAAIMAAPIEGATTFLQCQRLAASSLGGELTGAEPNSTKVSISNILKTKVRIQADVDDFGNRTNVQLDLT